MYVRFNIQIFVGISIHQILVVMLMAANFILKSWILGQRSDGSNEMSVACENTINLLFSDRKTYENLFLILCSLVWVVTSKQLTNQIT